MSKDFQNIKEIEDYLYGELTPQQRQAFEKKLQEDIELREEVDATKHAIEGVQGYAFKKMLKDLHARALQEQPITTS